MKLKVTFSLILLSALLLSSCDDMKDIPTPVSLPETPGESGHLYVLSEGLFNMNNSTLADVNFQNRTITPGFFESSNGRGLGDTANDMALDGNYLWIVVNVSSQVEIVDRATGISVRRIPLFNENGIARQPRYIAFAGNKAYVCCFDGYVVRIDKTTLEVDGTVLCGRNPDGITVSNNKLYVSNSGGLDQPNYDNTVSVIDLNSFTETKKITVGLNPYKAITDNEGDVYVVCRGNNSDIKPDLYCINSVADTVKQSFGVEAINITLSNDTAYMYNFDYVNNNYWIGKFDCKNEKLIPGNFITDSTQLERPFAINVNPNNGHVYLSDAHTYTIKGDLICFDRNGKHLYTLPSIGLNPNTIIAVSE